MMKKVVTKQPVPIKKLKLQRETFRRLTQAELRKAGGALYDWPPIHSEPSRVAGCDALEPE